VTRNCDPFTGIDGPCAETAPAQRPASPLLAQLKQKRLASLQAVELLVAGTGIGSYLPRIPLV
jgi:hypothetical protein